MFPLENLKKTWVCFTGTGFCISSEGLSFGWSVLRKTGAAGAAGGVHFVPLHLGLAGATLLQMYDLIDLAKIVLKIF